MSAAKLYTRILLGTASVLIAVWYAAAFYFDPYGVFGLSGYNRKNFPTNTRYQKIDHLLRNNGHDGYILGSSRVNYYPVDRASDLNGLSYYNLTVSAESSSGLLQKLRWLAAERKPRHVLIGLDFDYQFLQDVIAATDLLRQEHPAVSGENIYSFWLKYLSVGRKQIERMVRANAKPQTEWSLDLSSGHFALPRRDQLIAQNHPRYIEENFREAPESPGRLQERSFRNVTAILELLERSDIPRDIVITPYHHEKMASFRFDEYVAWLRRVVAIFGRVWDFSGFNSITLDDRNYYEYSHFRRHVGEWVLLRVLGSPGDQGKVPGDFGRLLTAENLELRIEQLSEESARYRNSAANLPRPGWRSRAGTIDP